MLVLPIVVGCLLAAPQQPQPQPRPQHAEAHWAYRPIVRPAEPEAARDAWCRSPLDGFVLAAMRAHGLEPSPPADRATWLRRVTLDLTGLPPTVAELEAFVADASACGDEGAATARVVERLLHGDAFAERWAQWWLDLARYADSQGYEKDALRPGMWRYREQVIEAFRRGQPFDQFTIEQLAGDLLPAATDEQRLATAFHRQTMSNSEGGTDDEEFRTAALVDRVDTTMSVWMGSTLGCAQCHDHKYDPFTQREFYELYAFFDQTADADRDDDAPRLRVPTERQRAQQKVLELELTELRARLAALDDAGVVAAPWRLLGPLVGNDFAEARDRAFAPERDGVQPDGEQDGLRWQVREDFRDGVVNPLVGQNSAFYLHRSVRAATAGEALLSLGSDDALEVWWNGERVLRRDVQRGAAPDQDRVAVKLQAGDNTLLLKITNGGGPGGFCCELWRGERATLRGRIAALEAEFDAARGPLVPVMQELPADRRRTTRVLRRGNFLDPGDVVMPGTPRIWPPFGDLPPNRFGLARWLCAADNPLTARVLANRLWSELFGAGLVATLEDFGTQGDPPTHPDLLDWLACELRDGWSIRELLRRIVLSATYAQGAAQDDLRRERDPDNRWLSRGPRVRLSAEMLRDQALLVSGLLTRTLGGPSVMPPQPDGVWRQIYSGARWQDADGPDRHRRTLYTFWRRTSPHPMLLVFDALSREACVLRRQRTNTPLQALVLWNDPQFHEPAVALGHRALQAADDDARRVAWLWRQCLLRDPMPREAARLGELLAAERAAGADETTAWTSVASVVLALDEFVSKG